MGENVDIISIKQPRTNMHEYSYNVLQSCIFIPDKQLEKDIDFFSDVPIALMILNQPITLPKNQFQTLWNKGMHTLLNLQS